MKKKYFNPETVYRTVLLEGTICSSTTVLNPNDEGVGKIEKHAVDTEFSTKNDFSGNDWSTVE